MINNINRNYYDVGNNTNTFNKNTLKQQIKAPSEQCEAVVTRMKDELQKSILIAIKIINEENITNTEEKFINTKYPDIKKLAEKLNKEKLETPMLLKFPLIISSGMTVATLLIILLLFLL